MRTTSPRTLRLIVVSITLAIAAILTAACGGQETVVQTVVVEKQVSVEKIVKETVVVEKQVEKQIEKKVEVPVEKVVKETVVVEKVVVATPTPSGPPPTPPAGSQGQLRVAASAIGPANFLPRNIVFPSNYSIVAWGLTDGLILHTFVPTPQIGEPTGEGVVKSWEVSPDNKKVTLKIRAGIPFHRGWGEVTAEDLAYTYNDTLREDSISKAGEMRTWMANWVVVDKSTVSFSVNEKTKELPAGWIDSLAHPHGSNGMVFSKAVFDKLGPEGANATPIGIGPYQVEKWSPGEEVRLRAVVPHYRRTSNVAELLIRELGELSTRLAAFRTGEVQIAPLPLKDLKNAIEQTKGYVVEPNLGSIRAFYFGGNYWLKVDPITGKPIERRPGLDPSLPWIGDPADSASMERARKVRLGMSLAINRELLNTQFAGGFGQTNQSVSYHGIQNSSKYYKKEWERLWAYDLNEAKRLLGDAGYAKGFKVTAFIAPDQAAIVPADMSQAVVQLWRDTLGLDVKIDSTAYAAMRPNLIARSHNQLYVWRLVPPDPALPACHGMCGGTGWTPGMEVPEIAENWKLSQEARTLDLVLQLKQKQDDAIYGNALFAPMLITPGLTAVRPEVKWGPPRASGPEGGSFEFAILSKP